MDFLSRKVVVYAQFASNDGMRRAKNNAGREKERFFRIRAVLDSTYMESHFLAASKSQ